MENETELSHILRNHAARYPAMEPTDAVKLLYQSEFGGSHPEHIGNRTFQPRDGIGYSS